MKKLFLFLIVLCVALVGCEYENRVIDSYYCNSNKVFFDENISFDVGLYTKNYIAKINIINYIDETFDKIEFYCNDMFMGNITNGYYTYSYKNKSNINYKLIYYYNSEKICIISNVIEVDYNIIDECL